MIVLLKGEVVRLKKYHIFTASLVTSIILIAVLHFSGVEDVTSLFPLLVFIDATSMAMLLIGVTMFFEKQEGAMKAMLVAPISKAEYILSKALANMLTALVSLIVMYIYALLFKEISASLAGLIAAMLLVSFFHTMIGFLLTYVSKSFTDLLVGMFKYLIILMVPVLLDHAGIIRSEAIKMLLLIMPTKTSLVLLQAPTGVIESWQVYISIIYLAAASLVLYRAALKKFDEFAAKESGV